LHFAVLKIIFKHYIYLYPGMKNCTFLILLALSLSFGATAQTSPEPGPAAARKVVRFYPNPATSFINFEFQKTPEPGTTFQVYNFLGKKLMEIQRFTARTQVDLTNYTRGLYIFQLTDPNGRVIESGKFQVEK
jgi:hypothetical protein